jgi:hypothetical protein
MKLKRFGLAALAAMALMAFLGTSSAAATELFADGETLESGTEIHGTLLSGNSALLTTTDSKTIIDTCTGSTLNGTTTNAEGETVGASIGSLTWSGCSTTTDTLSNGSLAISWTAGLNGTVTGSGSVVTVNFLGVSCRYGTGSGTHLGTLTGAEGESTAVVEFNAVVNEQEPKSFVCPDTTRWTAAYAVTSPLGLNVQQKEIVALKLSAPAFKVGQELDLKAENTGNVSWTRVVPEIFEGGGPEHPGAWEGPVEGCAPATVPVKGNCTRKLKCLKAGSTTWTLEVKSNAKQVAKQTLKVVCT